MQPLKTLKLFELTLPLRKQPSNWKKEKGKQQQQLKNLLFSENVVIPSSKCPGLSVHTVKLPAHYYHFI